jgi:hypothetical protein
MFVDPWASVSYFQKGAPEQVYVHEGTWEGFWSMITGGDHQRRNTIRNPIIQCVTFVQVDFWENERNKDNQHGVELALLGYDCQAANRTHSPMINRWCCGNIEFGRYWFGVLPLHVGYLFKTGYYKEPEASPTRTSLRFEERKIYK